jgi:hypothetical protein
LANDPTGQRASLFVPAARPSAWLIDDAKPNNPAATPRQAAEKGCDRCPHQAILSAAQQHVARCAPRATFQRAPADPSSRALARQCAVR